MTQIVTYDHRHWKARDPVRSPIDKLVTARLVVGWVTTSESLVLYVFSSFFFLTIPLLFHSVHHQLLDLYGTLYTFIFFKQQS